MKFEVVTDKKQARDFSEARTKRGDVMATRAGLDRRLQTAPYLRFDVMVPCGAYLQFFSLALPVHARPPSSTALTVSSHSYRIACCRRHMRYDVRCYAIYYSRYSWSSLPPCTLPWQLLPLAAWAARLRLRSQCAAEAGALQALHPETQMPQQLRGTARQAAAPRRP